MSIVHVLCCDICCLCLQTGVPVLSPYTGVIVELLVEDGATVKAHQPLMKIDVSGTSSLTKKISMLDQSNVKYGEICFQAKCKRSIQCK